MAEELHPEGEATFENVPPAAQKSADMAMGNVERDFSRSEMDPHKATNYGPVLGTPHLSHDKAEHVAHFPGVKKTEEELIKAQVTGDPASEIAFAESKRDQAVRKAEVDYEKEIESSDQQAA